MSNYVTSEGLEKLKIALAEAKVKLKSIGERIKEAKELGDLSENAEYHEAKNEQAFLLGKEMEIEQKIKNAQIISKHKNNDTVDIGSTVEIEDDGDTMKYEIVGSDEADPLKGRISIDSPIGSALIGHQKGQFVDVKTPAGVAKVKILSVS